MNAQFHKVIFSKRLGTLVAVGEHACAQGKSASGEGARGAALAAAVFLSGLTSAFALDPSALPSGPTAVAGAAAIAVNGARMDITQSTDRAAINWQSFNVGSSASVQVHQPSASSVLLNRVVGNEVSQIRGQINANGQVVLVNPNGIVMGPTGRITASAFTASSFDISDADFQAGQMRFQRSAHSGAVVNQGSIESTDAGGYVALIGADVSNQGTITTRQGAVVLAAADAVTLPSISAINNVSVPLSRNVRLELNPDSFGPASVSNSGVIQTAGGQVLMRAASVVDAVSKIADATVVQSGSIDTSGVQGGAVDILADHGRIRVSGSVKANSTHGTAGGDVYIGRDQDTNILAAIGDASGATLESKGGFVETSGQFLATYGTRITAKDWLLDPVNITIAASGATGTAYGDSDGATAGVQYNPSTGSTILASDIAANLNAGTNVIISTGLVGSSGTDNGNINVNSAIVKSGSNDASLTLIANNGIFVNQRIGKASNDTTSTGKLNLTLTAHGNATFATDSQGIVVSNVLDANGGTVTLSGTNLSTNGNSVGVSFGNGSGINAASYNVQGVATSTATSSYGVGMSGVVRFNSTLDSVINGTSLAQSTALTYGTTVNDGANVFFNAGNTGGRLVVKGSNAAWETGFRISGGGGSASVTTDGDVTLGALESNSQFSFRAGTITANSGSLSLLGQIAGNGTALSTFDGTSITANNGASIRIEGRVTGTNTSTAVGLGQNSSLTIQALRGTAASAGDITIVGRATNGTGVHINNANNTTWRANNINIQGVANTSGSATAYGVFFQRYASVTTMVASGDIHIEGTVQGSASGTGLTFEISGWGAQSTRLTASGDIVLRGNNRASASNARNAVYIASGVQAIAGGDVVLQAETNNAATTAINAFSNGASAWGNSLYGNMTLQATNDVLIQANQGTILFNNQLASTYTSGALTSETKITGRNITIDNTGAGMATGTGTAVTGTGGTQGATLGSGSIDTVTGVIAQGTGKSTSANAGVRLFDGRAITALDNINIMGVGTSGNGVEISGAATLTAGSAGYTGNLNITGENTNSGTSVAAINISNAASSLRAQNTATLVSLGTVTGNSLNAAGSINVGNELQVENPKNGTISGVISGSGLLRKRGGTGAGTLILTGANSYTGGTVANGGTLQVGNGSTVGNLGTGSISVAALLTVNRSNEYTITDAISGVGQLWHIGSGTTVLTGNNTYSGNTAISAGTLQIGNGGSTGTVGSGNVTLSNNSTLSFVRNVDTSLNSQVSGSGNLNATITGVGSDFNLGGNVNFSNTGSTVRLNTAGDVTQSSGSVAASNLFINSGGVVGTSANRIQSAVGAMALVSAGDQWVTEADYITLAASTTNNGSINIATTNGPMIVNATAINGLSGINANGTGNVTLTGQSNTQSGVRLLGDITALGGDVTVTGSTSTTSGTQAGVFSSATVRGKNITLNGSATGTSGQVLGYYGAGGHFIASETITITGTSASSTGNGLYSFSGSFNAGTGMSLSGTSTNGQGVGFDAGITITNGNSGNLVIAGTASTAGQQGIGLNGVVITNGTSGGGSSGAVTLQAHSGSLTSTTTFGGANRITQNGSGNVTLRTNGNNNLTVPIILNNGTGDVIVAAGSNIAAGTGTGGQVLTLSGNTITQNGSGKTYVYSGQASDTGQLSHLSSGFNQLFYQGTSEPINTQFNTAFSGTIAGGANTQLLFRSNAARPAFSLTLNNISKTYGDADPALAARNTALLNAYTGLDTLTTAVAGANSGTNIFAVTAADVINGLTGTSRAAGTNVGTYAYTDISGSAFNTTLSAQPSLVINKRNITLNSITAATKVYDGNTLATINGGTFGNIVSGETLALSGSGYFNSPNVNGVTTVSVTDASALSEAAGGTGSWSNYNLTASGSITSSATGKITAALLTATVNGSSIFVTQNASTAPNMGVRYDGFVGGDSADTALSGTAVRSYSGLSSYPAAATYAGVFGLGTVPTANHGNYTINVVAGDLQVRPADRLLISIGSQSVDYGSQTRANSVIAAIGSVTAVYCLNDSNCNGSNLFSLTTTRLSDTHWKAADNAGGVVVFSTGITGGVYSSGDYLRVGNYAFTQSAISRESSSGNPVLNFTNTYTNNGVLTVEPLTVTPTLSASDKTFDGNTSVTLSTSVSGRPGDSLSFNHVSASFDNASVGNNKTVTLYGVQLQGTDAANYRLASPTLTTLASILALPTPTPGTKPTPPVVKPVIPGPITPTPNGGGQTTLDDGGDSNSNPFALSVETDECRLDNLTACECEPNPLDETMDICYVPNRSGQASVAAPRS